MKIVKATIIGGLLAGALMSPSGSAIADDRHDFHIAQGHLPPPGKCRIWFPGRAPGRQPDPGDCRELSHRVPRGAWLVGHDRRWHYDEIHDRHFRREVFDAPRYSRREEIRNDVKDFHVARKAVIEDRKDLHGSYQELNKDRAELRRDIRSGASKQEILQDRREIRDDMKKIDANRKDLRQSQEKLQAAHRELKSDVHGR